MVSERIGFRYHRRSRKRLLRMDYYEYKVGEPNWWIKRPPERNKSFDKELVKLGGLNTFGSPILKAEWMGTYMSDSSYKPTLAFKKVWSGITHYDNSGLITIPVYQTLELGMLRWGIFKWMSTEDAIRGGRFNPDAEDGEGRPLYRRPPREGIYNLFFRVDTADGKYKPLDEEVLYAVREIWHYNENTSLEQKVADILADEQREITVGNEAAKAVW